MLFMHFVDITRMQSAMRKHEPDYLVLGYTRTMMGFLFFQSQPERILMIGLGGGSLAKYCRRHLPDTHFTAVEINPEVIVLRDKFSIPPDGACFKVICANGADYVSNQSEKVDVLIVDGFNHLGQPTCLSSAGFYDNCYDTLRDGGVMVVNLLMSDLKYGTYVSRMRDSFEDKVVVVDAEEHGNKIAFAYKGSASPPSIERLQEQLRTLGPKHAFPLHKTAQKLLQRLKQRTNHHQANDLL